MKHYPMTFEEYKKAVKKSLRPDLPELNDEQFEAFIERKIDVIKGDYEDNCLEYDEEPFDDNEFKIGCVNSTAYCLYLMK